MNYFKSLLVILIFHVAQIANAQEKVWGESYYPSSINAKADMEGLNNEIKELLPKFDVDYGYDGVNFKEWNTPKKIVTYNDRVEFRLGKQLVTFNYSDLLNENVSVDFLSVHLSSGYISPTMSYIFIGKFRITTEDPGEMYEIKKFADILFNIQYKLNVPRFDSLLTEFESIAAAYQRLVVKPSVSEQQREYIVKANLQTKVKNYEEAIKEFEKAVEIDPTSYPDAYSNIAILSAQISRYDKAIFNMKKYLMLVPEAEDARSSQDKIYQWKLMLE